MELNTKLRFAFLAAILVPFLMASTFEQKQSTLYTYQNSIEIQEEFITANASSGTIGTHGWFTTGGTTSQVPSETNTYGIIRRDTGAVSGTVAAMLLSGTQNQILIAANGTYIWRARLNTNDANTTVRIGAGNGYTVSPVGAGIYFEKADADTNWFAVARQAGAETRVDTGVAVTTNFQTFTIKKLPGSASFSVDGSSPVSVSATFPVSGIQPVAQIVNSAAASKTVDLDYFQMQVTGITR